MTHSVLDGENNRNEQDIKHENEPDVMEDLDSNTWVASDEMQNLPTSIFKKNILLPATRKAILQSEPRNKEISFEPPIMDKKLWTNMPKPIDNTLRMVYASKPDSSEEDQHNVWVRREQALKATPVRYDYSPEWKQLSPLRRIPISKRKYSEKNLRIFQKEINSLLVNAMIQGMDPDIPCFTSNLFIIPKKTGDFRAIIDLRKLNQYVKYKHFKLEGLDIVKSLVRRGDYMTSIDLNQAFYHVQRVIISFRTRLLERDCYTKK
ncbi:11305_t:CDS:2, partial [Funneliformis mosseae]